MNIARSTAPAVLHWDGASLRGEATGRRVAVTIPLRLASTRQEPLPPGDPQALKAALRLKAERAFAPLGAVAVDALLPPAGGGAALLLAVPRTTIEAVRQAVAAQGHQLTAIRIAELCRPVPAGGVVEAWGEAALVASQPGRAPLVAALGRTDDPGFAATLARERLRLGIGVDAPPGPAAGAGIDVLCPGLSAPQPLLARRGVRLALLAGAATAAVLLLAALHVTDLLAARSEARIEADRLRPLAKVLAARRAELKEVAPWCEARPALAPGLHALAAALPAADSGDQVRLVRVRQSPDGDAVAEGAAGDRAQMMAFLERLRRDPRVASAEIRSSRSPSRDARQVVFELVFRLKEGGHASA